MHSTNYLDTFIAIAPDSDAQEGTAPKRGEKPSIAFLTFELIHDHPYRYTSDDVLFEVHAMRKGVVTEERSAARAAFFAKPQACLRASDLGKRYGWGIHSDAQGRVALYGMQSTEYAALVEGKSPTQPVRPITVKQAMRSKR